MTDDLITWLRAQLDEDEKLALICDAQDWRYPTNGVIVDRDVDGWQGAPDAARIFSFVDPDRSDEAVHAINHDPARVLAEVDAKRRIMAIHHPERFEGMGGLPQICAGCGYEGICDDPVTEDINDCPILRLLALPYADRPGYRDEWKPLI